LKNIANRASKLIDDIKIDDFILSGISKFKVNYKATTDDED